MTLKDICTSRDLSRRLDEAGFEQGDGIAYWILNGITGKWEFMEKYEGAIPRARAFTFNELWELLPKRISEGRRTYYLNLEHGGISYKEATPRDELSCLYIQDFHPIESTPQEAAGELLLWCRKNNYLKED